MTSLLLLLLVGVGFAACSDDNDEKQSSNSGLVGSWYYQDDDEYELITFNSNATGTWYESYVYDDGDTYSETESFRYTYKNGILTMYAGDEVEKWPLSVLGDIMIWDGQTYRRVR